VLDQRCGSSHGDDDDYDDNVVAFVFLRRPGCSVSLGANR
jgi:hypothetical protein